MNYITKDINSAYFTAISINNEPKTPSSLNTSPIANAKPTFTTQIDDSAISYFIYQTGKEPFLVNKTWEISGLHTYQNSSAIVSLSNGDKFSYYIATSDSIGSWGPQYLIGQGAIGAYITKWISHYYLISSLPVAFKIKITNMTSQEIPINLTNPVGEAAVTGVSDGGVYENGVITWPRINLTAGQSKIYSFSLAPL